MPTPTVMEVVLSGLQNVISQLDDFDVEVSEDYDETLFVEGELQGHGNCFLVVVGTDDVFEIQIHSKEVGPIENPFDRSSEVIIPWKERRQFELSDPNFFDSVTAHLHDMGIAITPDWHRLP